MIKLLLVDDQLTVRTGLQMLLEAETDLCVVGEAADGDSAIEMAASLDPDVVLMDVQMPGIDGITLARALRKISATTRVIILSMHDDPVTRERAAAAGAAAFVSKSTPASTLLTAIRQVAH